MIPELEVDFGSTYAPLLGTFWAVGKLLVTTLAYLNCSGLLIVLLVTPS